MINTAKIGNIENRPHNAEPRNIYVSAIDISMKNFRPDKRIFGLKNLMTWFSSTTSERAATKIILAEMIVNIWTAPETN